MYAYYKLLKHSPAPSPVQDAVLTLINGFIRVTWTPPIVPNGIIYQYIVQRINSIGKFYSYFSATNNHTTLPYFNDTVVFVAAVNLYGQSKFIHAVPEGMCNNIDVQK